MTWFKIVLLVVYVFMVGFQPYLLNKEKRTLQVGLFFLIAEVISIIAINEWLIILYFLAIPLTFALSLKASSGIVTFANDKSTTLID